MYRKYRIVESIASSVSQYELYHEQVYRYTPIADVWDRAALAKPFNTLTLRQNGRHIPDDIPVHFREWKYMTFD